MLTNITKHAYWPTAIFPDKGSAFMSHVLEEVVDVFGITSKHATTNQPQTVSMLEQSHTAIKQT